MASSDSKDIKNNSDTTNSFVERELNDDVDDITLDSYSYNKENESKNDVKDGLMNDEKDGLMNDEKDGLMNDEKDGSKNDEKEGSKNDEENASKNESDPYIGSYHTDIGNQTNDTQSTSTSEVQTVNFTGNYAYESTTDNSTLDFTPMILKSVHSDDNEAVILDRENHPVHELGFEESIMLPQDFKSTDIKLMIDNNGFCVFSDKENTRDSETKTASYHQMKYTRIFDRPIRNVNMEYTQGKIIVYGEFDDYNYPQ